MIPIDPLIANRWSPRAFDPDLPVEPHQLESLLEAARWAPSCFGDQPWRFVVCDRHTDEAAWNTAYACLVEGNQVWARNAPVLILSCAVNAFSHNGKPNRWAQYDTGAASENLCLQAPVYGLAAHQMGGFDPDAARSGFGIPDDVSLMAMIAVGHPGDPDSLPEELRERELADRERLPLASIAFQGRWVNG